MVLRQDSLNLDKNQELKCLIHVMTLMIRRLQLRFSLTIKATSFPLDSMPYKDTLRC